jgi:hypothetical protein
MSRRFSPAVSTGLTKPQSNSPDAAPCAVIEPAGLTLSQAIFFSDHPAALARDYPAVGDQARVLRRMDVLFARAEREQPLIWQAYRARTVRSEAVGTERAAQIIVAFKRLGGQAPLVPSAPR